MVRPSVRSPVMSRVWLWCVGVLAWSVVANLGLGDAWYVTRNLLLAVVLVGVGVRAHGWAGIGLGHPRLVPGLGVGLVAALGVGIVLVVAIPTARVVPIVASLLDDTRAAEVADSVLFVVLIRIPFGTALFEEVLFRGVLLAEVRSRLRPLAAVVLSSVVFGLWHIPPTIVALRLNDVAVGSAAGLSGIVGAVLVTTVAGIGFCWLRLRVDSLVAPVVVHWAINAGALLAAIAYQSGP
jgi:uncharacterized protein